MSVAAYFSIFKFFRAPILCSLYRIGVLKKLKIERVQQAFPDGL